MEITVQDNIKEFTRKLTEFQRKQIPYATSRALNDIAVAAQEQIQEEIPTKFNVRKKWWLKQQPTGIKVKFSRKDDLHSAVYTNAHFAQLQEEGGTKTPHRSHHLAIPTGSVPKKYFTSKGAREMVSANSRVFLTKKGIFRRKGKKNVELLWSFATSARVTPRFGFAATATKVVKSKFGQFFAKRLQQSLRTARF